MKHNTRRILNGILGGAIIETGILGGLSLYFIHECMATLAVALLLTFASICVGGFLIGLAEEPASK